MVLSKTDQNKVNKANKHLSEVYKLLPDYAIKNNDLTVVTNAVIDEAQIFYEKVEGMRLYKGTKRETKMHWQLGKIGGRLKAARATANYPHPRQQKSG